MTATALPEDFGDSPRTLIKGRETRAQRRLLIPLADRAGRRFMGPRDPNRRRPRING